MSPNCRHTCSKLSKWSPWSHCRPAHAVPPALPQNISSSHNHWLSYLEADWEFKSHGIGFSSYLVFWSSPLNPWCYSIGLFCWWLLSWRGLGSCLRCEDSRENQPNMAWGRGCTPLSHLGTPVRGGISGPAEEYPMTLLLSLVSNCLDSKPAWGMKAYYKYSFGRWGRKVSFDTAISDSKDTLHPRRRPLRRHWCADSALPKLSL